MTVIRIFLNIPLRTSLGVFLKIITLSSFLSFCSNKFKFLNKYNLVCIFEVKELKVLLVSFFEILLFFVILFLVPFIPKIDKINF